MVGGQQQLMILSPVRDVAAVCFWAGGGEGMGWGKWKVGWGDTKLIETEGAGGLGEGRGVWGKNKIEVWWKGCKGEWECEKKKRGNAHVFFVVVVLGTRGWCTLMCACWGGCWCWW